jgi:hypothetical protein
MSKGITAFYIVLSVIVALSMLGGIGFYSSINLDYSDSADADVQNAADALVGQEATDRSGGSVLQDFTTAGATAISTGWQVIANLSGILQLLFMLPEVVADAIQTAWQVTFGLTFAFFIRGLLL